MKYLFFIKLIKFKVSLYKRYALVLYRQSKVKRLKPTIINNLKDNKKLEKLFFEVQKKRFTCQCDQTGGYTIK